jgi:hypothetical protein
MPAKPRSTTSTPRTPRRKAKPTAETCPVLAGFARLKQIEADQAAVIVSDPAPIDSPIDSRAPFKPAPAPSRSPWLRLLIIFALGVTLGTSIEFPSRNLGRQTIRRYARECDAQACTALRQANDGDMTGEEAAQIIERVSPSIKYNAWQTAAERFTALQDADGKIDQATAAALIDELSRGFRSIH